MNRPQRNDPCPCGSGKKYKACCLERDRGVDRTLRIVGGAAPAVGEKHWEPAIRGAEVWEADVVPLHAGFADDPGALPALAIVGAAGFIVHGDVISPRPVGVAARASAVAEAVLAAARRVGVLPAALHVRDQALADALAPGLAPRGVAVRAAPITELDEAIEGSLEHMAGGRAAGIASSPGTWAETEASPEEIARLHAAVAAFHRAEPWERVGDQEALELRFPDGRVFMASVMGGAGIDYGLALYSDPRDLDALLENDGDAMEQVRAMRGWSMSAGFQPRSRMSRAMQREVASAGWEVAATDAYPMLLGIRIPGRRVTADHVRVMTRALTAVLGELCGPGAVAGIEDPGVEVVRDDDSPWAPLLEAHPIGAGGPLANPAAALAHAWHMDPREYRRLYDEAMDRAERFAAWLEGQKLSKAARRRHARNAKVWCGYLSAITVPAEAATEYDLRIYLYDWFPRKEKVPADVERVLPESLNLFFAWMEAEEGIGYPWAPRVLMECADVADEYGHDIVWGAELWEDLIARVMRHDEELPGTRDGWPGMMNVEVAMARHELQRRWLIWYDEAVRAGTTDLGELRDVLVERQRAWEDVRRP
ncbi:MAG TPA: SEC-C metal-binding domain-containing protein, partial [Longimicrobium sp.]|nr:SEC-C metal-binding domain-containing protein [Longimicrobium sp.]